MSLVKSLLTMRAIVSGTFRRGSERLILMRRAPPVKPDSPRDAKVVA